MVPIRPPISKSSNPISKALGTLSNTPVTIDISVTLIVHSFFSLFW